MLVACCGNDVIVFDLKTLNNIFRCEATHGMIIHCLPISKYTSSRLLYRLEGHQAFVLAACFCEPHEPYLLVTAGEDRTFRVWDLEEGIMIYQVRINDSLWLQIYFLWNQSPITFHAFFLTSAELHSLSLTGDGPRHRPLVLQASGRPRGRNGPIL